MSSPNLIVNPKDDDLLGFFQTLTPEQLTLAHKLVQKKFTSQKIFDPVYQKAATALSLTGLKIELLQQRKRPLEAQARIQKAALDAAGHRPGPSPAFRLVAAKIAPSRAAWEALTPAEKKQKEEAMRDEIMLTDEFALLFPAEAYAARRKAGVGPAILVSLDGEIKVVETASEVAAAETANDKSEMEGVSTAGV